MIALETDRLILRGWEARDHAPFAAINADLRVMDYFPELLSYDQSIASIERWQSYADKCGYCFQPVEEKATSSFVGFVGLSPTSFDAHFTPAIEIGWRLGAQHWGKGYAGEAASALLQHGFQILNLAQIVSLAVVGNRKSRAVMEKIGMSRDPGDDFDHPALDPGHRLSRHVLYRISQTNF